MTRALPIRPRAIAIRRVAVAAVLVLAACGGGSAPPTQNPPPGSPPPSNPPPSGGSGDVQINIQNIAYHTPNGTDSITVDVGSTIQWTNKDEGIQHSATSDSVPSGASSFDSGLMNVDGTFTYTVDQPGRYVYHCTVHPGQMAHAVIIAK